MTNQLHQLLLPWYRANGRDLPWRKDREPYHVWLSEIMLQQTRVEAVKGYYNRFLTALPTIEALATVDSDSLHKLWEGLGYYSRVRNLQKAAQIILELHQGQFPTAYDQVRALPGIGDYTAGAVCSICFAQPTPAVDGNVLRVMARMEGDRTSILDPKRKKQVAQTLGNMYPQDACGDFTQALMELGATVCIPNGAPKCEACPVSALCVGYRQGIAQELPVKGEKKPRKQESRTVFLLFCGDAVAVEKRPSKGLLAGLWQFPNVVGHLEVDQAMELLESWGCGGQVKQYVEKTHIFTHIQWNMSAYTVEITEKAEQFHWVTKAQLERDIALPTAFKQFWT